jgi:hypothetical protein
LLTTNRAPINLTPEDNAYLDPILNALAQRAGRPEAFTLDFLVDYWWDFVSEVERGYQGAIDAYVNDLIVRDILEKEIIDPAPARLKLKVALVLVNPDTRFRDATQEFERPIRPLPDGKQRAWWWYRAPKNVNASWS